MTIYLYEGVDKEGKEVSGEMKVVSRNSLLNILQDKGVTISSVKEKKAKNFNIVLFRRIKSKEMVIFLQQLATLFEADVPVLRIFVLVARQTKNEYFKEILTDISDQIKNGVSLSLAFAKYRHVFGDFFISIVEVGEVSGTMSRSFLYLAAYKERSYEITTKARRALTYPIFISVTFLVVMFIMFITVIPQLSAIFIDSGAEIPKITAIILSISNFLVGNVYFIITLFFGGIAFVAWYFRTEGGRYALDNFLLTAPLMGNLFRQLYAARFTDNLSIMLSSGVTILKAFESIGGVVGNKVFAEALSEIALKIKAGQSLSSALNAEPLIGQDISALVRTGEEAGQLAKIMSTISKFYQQQFSNAVNTMIDLIQPAIIIVFAGSVGLLLASVLLPIYSITTAI